MSDDGAEDVRRAVCAGCGCVCDDLPLDGPPFREGRPNVDTDCERGRRWFARRVFGSTTAGRRPALDGQPVGLDDAAARAAELLAGATHPRVAGLERLPLGAQRKLVEIADRAGAAIDTGPSPDHLSSVLAVQRDGGSFVTLGEIRQRVDCLVLWFVEPARTHPRLLERFYPRGEESASGGPSGDEGPAGHGRPEDRTLVAVGPRAGETRADVAVTVERGRSLELLWLLRLLADEPAAREREEHPLGEVAARLLEPLRTASCGAWIFEGSGAEGADAPGRAGGGDASGREAAEAGGPGPVETAGLLRFLHRLNDEAPWGARPLRGEGNPAGAEAVLTWQSGYPAAVSYRSGRPAYAGPAHSAGRSPGGRLHDVVLVAGGDPARPPRAEGDVRVWIDTGAGPAASGEDAGDAGPSDPPAVRIPVLPPGARAGDTLLRMDGVSVRSPGIPGADGWDGAPAEEALDAVLRELKRIRREEEKA